MLMVENVSQKISFLVFQHGRIQAGHMGIVKKERFIVGKGKGIICFTGRKEALHQQKEREEKKEGLF
jgi:hypothetical protein